MLQGRPGIFFRAHELFVASDQLSGVAMSLNNMGNVHGARGDIVSALLFFYESLAIYSDIGDPLGRVQVLCNKATALIDTGRFEKYEKISEKTGMDLSITKHFVNRWLEGKTLESLCE